MLNSRQIVFAALLIFSTSCSEASQDQKALQDRFAQQRERLEALEGRKAFEASLAAMRRGSLEARAIKLADGRLAFASSGGKYLDQSGRPVSSQDIAKGRKPQGSANDGGQVIAWMNADQLAGYVTGLGQMLAYRLFVEGDQDGGRCVQDWVRQTTASQNGLEKIHATFEANPALRSEQAVYVLANRVCGLEK